MQDGRHICPSRHTLATCSPCQPWGLAGSPSGRPPVPELPEGAGPPGGVEAEQQVSPELWDAQGRYGEPGGAAGSGGARALKDSESLRRRGVKQRQPALFSLSGKGGWFPL